MKTASPALLFGRALILASFLVGGAAIAQPPAPPAAGPPPSTEDGSYLIGVQYGEQLVRAGVASDLSSGAVTRGVADGLAGKKLDAADQQRARDFVRATVEASLNRNREAAKEFLARNGKEKGVRTNASGMQYKVVAPGDAKANSPGPTDRVSVNYRGRLLDGSEFDSSYAHGQPATFPVNAVIKGWQEALVSMKPGEKRVLWVPPDLAYDATPRPGIPAGSLLVFDVELLKVLPPDAPAATPGAP